MILMAFCFFFGVWGSWLPSQGTKPSTVRGCCLSLLLHFLRICCIPINLPTEEERLAWMAFPFCFFCFSSIPLHQRETIVLFQRSASALLILLFFVSSAVAMIPHAGGGAANDPHGILLLFWGLGKLVAQPRNQTVHSPWVLSVITSPFFEDLLYTNQLSN